MDDNGDRPDWERRRKKWEEYERRKKELREMGLSQDEYEQRIRELIDELNI